MTWRIKISVVLMVLASYLFADSSYLLVKAQLAQYLLERAWHKQLHDGEFYSPWPWADTHPITRVSFPKQGVSFIVLAGASGRNLAFAPAHLSASVLPGESGVSVIGGHRDTHFAFLQTLIKGDVFFVENAQGHSSQYQVMDIQITDIQQSDISLLAERPVIALVTCYPFVSLNRHETLRYLVLAEAV